MDVLFRHFLIRFQVVIECITRPKLALLYIHYYRYPISYKNAKKGESNKLNLPLITLRSLAPPPDAVHAANLPDVK